MNICSFLLLALGGKWIYSQPSSNPNATITPVKHVIPKPRIRAPFHIQTEFCPQRRSYLRGVNCSNIQFRYFIFEIFSIKHDGQDLTTYISLDICFPTITKPVIPIVFGSCKYLRYEKNKYANTSVIINNPALNIMDFEAPDSWSLFAISRILLLSTCSLFQLLTNMLSSPS